MNAESGTITQTASTYYHTKEKLFSIADFTGVGIGTIGKGGPSGNVITRTRYCVRLLGPTNLNIPVMSNDKEAMIALAEKVGDYLNLPVDKEPTLIFFKMRL